MDTAISAPKVCRFCSCPLPRQTWVTHCRECFENRLCQPCEGEFAKHPGQAFCTTCTRGLLAFHRAMRSFPRRRPDAETLERNLREYERLAALELPLWGTVLLDSFEDGTAGIVATSPDQERSPFDARNSAS